MKDGEATRSPCLTELLRRGEESEIVDRVGAISHAYLRWLCRADEESQRMPPPLWNEFLSDQESIVDGQQVTEGELREVMPWLTAHRIIGGGIAEINLPVRVLLTRDRPDLPDGSRR